jgi:L-threonylcarbamoyladenylate synthase
MTSVLKAFEDERVIHHEAIGRAAEFIRRGGVVAYPTETVYGLGALAYDHESVARVYRLKQRARHKPLSLLIEDLAQLEPLVRAITPRTRSLMARFWPGPLTLLLPAAEDLPEILTGGTGKAGVRISSHPVARELVAAVGAPITATSANRSGAPSCRTSEEVLKQMDEELTLILDGGLTPDSRGSTIVNVAVEPPVIVRVGAIAAEEVLRCWQHGPALR